MASLQSQRESGGTIDLGEVVAEAFGDDAGAASEYAKELRAVRVEVTKSLGRTSFLIVLLIAFFFLLISSSRGGTRISIAGIDVEDAGAIEKILPLVVAYLAYELGDLTSRLSRIDWTLLALSARFWPRLNVNELDELLLARLPQLSKFGSLPSKPMSSLALVEQAAQMVMIGGLLFGPLVFEFFAYFELFSRHGATDVLVWVTLALSALIVVSASAAAVRDLTVDQYEITAPALSSDS